MAYPYQQVYTNVPAWYNQFYQPIQPPIQQPAQPQIVPQMAQFQQQVAQAQAQPQQQGAVQMGGFIRVPSEEVARNWNVAPGTSATFINENAPYCYTKTVEMSQLDRPKFDKYRLVKEEDAPAMVPEDGSVGHENAPQRSEGRKINNLSEYALKTDVEQIWARLEALEGRVESGRRNRTERIEKKGEIDDGESID